jgi:hypothetical protein
MTGSGVGSSWTDTSSQLREVRLHTQANDQVISLSSFQGRFNPSMYLDWELEVEQVFSRHDFSELERVRAATRAFTGFASVWWSMYCKKNIDNQPKTWKDLKDVMRQQFVPAYYRRELLHKLEQLKQGSNTVNSYYKEFKSYMHHCDIEESEDDAMNRFFHGLNHDIRARFQYIPHCIIGMYVRACTFERQIQEDALGDYNNYYSSSCSPQPVVSFTVAPTRATTPQIVSAASPQVYGTLPSSVPTSSESLRQGNNKGIDDTTSHEDDECLVDLNTSCVELPIDLSTTPNLVNHVTVMNVSCDQTTEIPTILSAPIELSVDAKEPCESGNKSDLDQLRLKIIVPMFNLFYMTSNLGDDSVLNDLLHVCLLQHVVACHYEHCQSLDMNKSFTYMCKLSCNIFMPSTSCDSSLPYSRINVSDVQKLRDIKMDDIYIYNMYTLSLLLATFQIKQRRGRLCFQEGEDDEDMATLDTTKNIAYMHIFKVISYKNYAIIYLCYPEQKYFTYFYFMPKCRIVEHLYEPRVKTKEKKMIRCCSRSPLMSKEMFRCCSRSSPTSLLAQEKIESKSPTFWTQIRTALTYLNQNAKNSFIRTPNWVILFLLESLFRALSNPIGFTFKFVRSIEILMKQSDIAAESESNYKSKGVASPPLGPMGLVRPRVSFRLPWDVLPPPWPPPLAPI